MMSKKAQRSNTLPRTLSTGPLLSKRNNMKPKLGVKEILQAVQNTLSFDNCCVNTWDYDLAHTAGKEPTVARLTDVPARGVLDAEELNTLSSTAAAPTLLQGLWGSYKFQETRTSDDTHNVAICLTAGGPQVALLKESPNGKRQAVGKVPSPNGVPCLHAFGLTDRHAVVVIPPLRTNLGDIKGFLEEGCLRSMTEVDQTRVVVFDFETGEAVVDQTVG
jgi:hypothetical protein